MNEVKSRQRLRRKWVNWKYERVFYKIVVFFGLMFLTMNPMSPRNAWHIL